MHSGRKIFFSLDATQLDHAAHNQGKSAPQIAAPSVNRRRLAATKISLIRLFSGKFQPPFAPSLKAGKEHRILTGKFSLKVCTNQRDNSLTLKTKDEFVDRWNGTINRLSTTTPKLLVASGPCSVPPRRRMLRLRGHTAIDRPL